MEYNILNLSNISTSSSDTTEDLRTAQLVVALLLSAVGLTGNSLTIYHIIQQGLYKQVCNKYILNLSINNLITCVMTTPIVGISFYTQQWIFGDTFCYIFPYLMHTTLCSETNALLLITINRYLIVVHPGLYNTHYKKKHSSVLLIGASWFIYMAIQTLPLANIWGKFEYNQHKHYCTYAEDSETKTFIASLCALILLTNLPVHVFCYGTILLKYKQSKQRMSITKCRTHHRKYRRKGRGSRKDMCVVRMIVVIILCFALTHTPFLVVNAVDPMLTLTGITTYTVTAYIALSHTAFNPVVYALMNKQICGNSCKSPLCWQDKPVTSL